MYKNLKAEQARRGLTNSQVAERLGIKRNTYERKCRQGKFYPDEVKVLTRLFECDFNYLFATDDTAS